MERTINAKELRASLPRIVEQVRKGGRFTVIYRSRPAFLIVPVYNVTASDQPATSDALYKAGPVGRSRDGRKAADHDALVYG